MNGELQTPWLSCISNAALLSLKGLSIGANISSKKWLRDLFFNEDFNVSPTIFHSQPHVEHMLTEKGTVMQNNFTLYETSVFFFKCPTLHISKVNSLLDLQRLLDI